MSHRFVVPKIRIFVTSCSKMFAYTYHRSNNAVLIGSKSYSLNCQGFAVSIQAFNLCFTLFTSRSQVDLSSTSSVITFLSYVNLPFLHLCSPKGVIFVPVGISVISSVISQSSLPYVHLLESNINPNGYLWSFFPVLLL